MKKLLCMMALMAGFAIQAQVTGDVSYNAGILTHESHLSGVGNLDQFTNNVEIELDLFGDKKFNFGPVGKLHFTEHEFFGGKDQNDYDVSLGLNAGFDLGRFSFDTSAEVPFPDYRDGVGELLISPSVTYMLGKKVGIKANFDYFINKKLFNYAYSIGGGVVYKF